MEHPWYRSLLPVFPIFLIICLMVAAGIGIASLVPVAGRTPALGQIRVPTDIAVRAVTAVSPAPTLRPEPSPVMPTTDTSKRWLIAVGAVLMVQNREGYETLASGIPKTQLVPLLKDWWDVTDRDSALSVLSWLKTSGHRAQYDEFRTAVIRQAGGTDAGFAELKKNLLARAGTSDRAAMEFLLDFTWKHRNSLTATTMSAWDCMRLVNVARWSYTLGFITEAEAWQYISWAGATVKRAYTSWDEMGRYYLLGRTYWQRSEDNAAAESALAWLTASPQSPWRTLPWDTAIR